MQTELSESFMIPDFVNQRLVIYLKCYPKDIWLSLAKGDEKITASAQVTLPGLKKRKEK